MNPFQPAKVYYEAPSRNYYLGQKLLDHYSSLGIPLEEIPNHNNIESLRTQPNRNFPQLKKYLIIGVRKTHKYTPNEKVSDFLVPYTSSGCTAMCLYCYLVCNYNKCAYLRLFVNREEMLEKLIRKAQSFSEPKVFEIGSNSDLILENSITGNLVWTIENFLRQPHGKLTFPTKFDMVEPLLNLEHQKRIIARVSINPQEIIARTEFKTSSLTGRIKAIKLLQKAGYPVGILIAPIILVENWRQLYADLLERLKDELEPGFRKDIFFEVIFMTYSFVHNKINSEAFPKAMAVYDPHLMTGRGRGKYWYKNQLRLDGERFIREQLELHFPGNTILYIV